MDNRQLWKTYTVLEDCSSFTKRNDISIGNISSTVHSTCNWYGSNSIHKWVPRSRLAYQQTVFDKPTMLYTSNRSTVLPGCFIINLFVTIHSNLFMDLADGFSVARRMMNTDSNPLFLYFPKSIPQNFITSQKLNKFVLLREHSHHGRRRRRMTMTNTRT